MEIPRALITCQIFVLGKPFSPSCSSLFSVGTIFFTKFRAIKSEKKGDNTNLADKYEISIYEDPVGTYFEYKVQEEAWNDDDCKFILKLKMTF